jgi:hypothetical protein
MQSNNGAHRRLCTSTNFRNSHLEVRKEPGISTNGELRRMTYEFGVLLIAASSSRATAGMRHAKSSRRFSKRTPPLSISSAQTTPAPWGDAIDIEQVKECSA